LIYFNTGCAINDLDTIFGLAFSEIKYLNGNFPLVVVNFIHSFSINKYFIKNLKFFCPKAVTTPPAVV